MGYTHYFDSKKDVPPTQWHDFKQAVITVFDALPTLKPGLDICDLGGEKVLNQASELFPEHDKLLFNGNEAYGLDHETFALARIRRYNGEFCKTNQKSYDWFVIVVLILAHNLCPDCFSIRSDGDRDEWQPVLDKINLFFNEQYVLPDNITVP